MRLRVNNMINLTAIALLSSCNVIEKSSSHGFESGYYQLKSTSNHTEKIYAAVTNEKVMLYQLSESKVYNKALMTILLSASDSLCHYPLIFYKKSLDIDITTVLFKFRPAIYQLPPQMNTDFNAAIYTGWRSDAYRIQSNESPIGNCTYKISNRGYDVGAFAGAGATSVGPFSTRNAVNNDYSGMTFQFGLAAFIESTFASFGLATGLDYLLSPDKNVWVYNGKPWIGFIIGIALN